MSEDNVTVRLPTKWLDRALQGLTLSCVVGLGGIWSSSQDQQAAATASLIASVRDNTTQLDALESGLAAELDRRRAAESAAVRASALLEARIAVLEARR